MTTEQDTTSWVDATTSWVDATPEERKALFAALAATQLALEGGGVKKDRENPHFRHRYATLEAVLERALPVAAQHGLALCQLPTGEELVSVLTHKDGGALVARYPIRPVKNDPQGVGSAITYARRYTAMAMLGLAPEDDDDANAASGRSGQSRPQHGRGRQPAQSRPQPQPAAPRSAEEPEQKPAQPSGGEGRSRFVVWLLERLMEYRIREQDVCLYMETQPPLRVQTEEMRRRCLDLLQMIQEQGSGPFWEEIDRIQTETDLGAQS